MFDPSTAFTHAGLSAALLVVTGIAFPTIPDELVLFGISVAGSGAAIGFRSLAGYVPDRGSRWLAFISGILVALVAVPYVQKALGLEGMEVGVFVLLLSLIGARVVKYLSTDFDVGGFVDGIMSRFSKK